MLELDGKFLVSNGDQTRTAFEGLRAGRSLREALSEREREPDAPNYTPRITGMLDVGGDEVSIALSILKANRSDPTTRIAGIIIPAPLEREKGIR